MNWNLPADHTGSYLPATISSSETREFKGRYLKILSVYFASLTLSFPVQIFLLQDFSLSDSINWGDFAQQIPILNWACMLSYSATAVALVRRSSRIWAHLSAAFLLTAINNTFVAFAGWDYSAIQVLAGTAMFTVPLAPTLMIPAYRKLIWMQRQGHFAETSPRFKKRWRVELLSEGQAVPATGITINISESGALIHLLNQTAQQNMFDVRLTEAHQGLILDCKARRVREAVMPTSGAKIPVMGIEFLSLSEDQKQNLQTNLYKTRQAS